MKSFQVLEKEQDIHRNYLLEASAGTGKTFSIENIVVRLLIEKEPLPIEKILVVTFTRAATRDLKVRIRKNIENSLHLLKHPEEIYSGHYLEPFIGCTKAIRRLEHALLGFDQAQIFTIHGFCSRMLQDYVFEGNLGLDTLASEENLPRTLVLKVIRDFFRTEIRPERYSQAQLERVTKKHKKLENDLLNTITKGISIEEPPHCTQLLEQFRDVMSKLSFITSEKILSDFGIQAPYYKGMSRGIKPEIMDRVTAFSSLFDKKEWTAKEFDLLIRDQLYILDLLEPGKVLKKGPPPTDQLNYPNLREDLQVLVPLISVETVYARMAYDCKKLLKRYLNEEEKLGFDELLEATYQALDNPTFVQNLRERYTSAIIDEFQDTDPIQWKIFEKLFHPKGENWGHLYLVGDPKQSIYAFRQADIYTYLAAGDALGEEHHASLDTNYRSQPQLVDKLNALFSAPGLISLPHLNSSLGYIDVKAGRKIDKIFLDNKNCVNFFQVDADKLNLEELETNFFFPYITQEIQRLNLNDNISFREMAILVADRFQMERIASFLKKWNIPAATQRRGSLSESPALGTMQELLAGILNPRHESSLKTALGGKIFGWTHEEIRELEDVDRMQKVLAQFYRLRNLLLTEGFPHFYQQLMMETKAAERLLSEENGVVFYHDFEQIAMILFEHQSKNHVTPEGLLRFLDDFDLLNINEDDRIKRASDPTRDAVNIMTLHASKGLEFEIVFALGLIKRSRAPEQLVPMVRNGERRLVAVPDKNSPDYLQHCEEVDAEKIRQLYVAMTRAKDRLYCPIIHLKNPKPIDPGCASPMELFLQRQESQIEADILNDIKFDLIKNKGDQIPELISPPRVIIPGKPSFIQSFTTLSKLLESHTSSKEAPHDFNAEEKTPHTLPAGSETGTLLHLILEKGGDVMSYVQNTPYEPWSEVITEIVEKAFQTPLTDRFCLNDISPKKCFKEMEFLYPKKNDFIKGVIDLVFEHEGNYYILDWKTNWLGPNEASYKQENLKKAMEEHHYFLQAELYKEAWQRYLNEPFGGAFYVFLRGNAVYKVD